MIFNESYTSSAADMSGIKESPYPLGLEGALMHVYENECNYNALMKSVGIAEARYAVENGGELFVQEAGAFGSFLDNAKKFFLKIIEKIKQIFKKFVAFMDRFVLDNKSFVKKYGDQVLRRNLTDFEVDNCYKFEKLEDTNSKLSSTPGDVNKECSKSFDEMKKTIHDNKNDSNGKLSDDPYHYSTKDLRSGEDAVGMRSFKDSDEIDEYIAKWRGKIIGDSKSFDEKEFTEEITERCYGDKETIPYDTAKLRTVLEHIKNTQDAVKKAGKTKDAIVKSIEGVIKEMESLIKEINKTRPATSATDAQANADTKAINLINQDITVLKGVSNAYTVAFGIVVRAFNDRAKQGKAVCVKALSYKHEAVTYGGSADDLFANVSIY